METVINILILETEPSDTVAVLDELHRPDLKIGTLEIKRPADVLPKLEMNPPGAILACTREPGSRRWNVCAWTGSWATAAR